MLCASTIMLETKVKYMQFLSHLCEATWQRVSKQKKCSLVTLAVLVYSFNNLATTLWNSSNTTDNAVFAVFMFIFSRTSALKFTGVFSRHR